MSERRPVQAEPAATRLFAVRLWKEELTGGSEYRGSVRDVTTGSFHAFRDWSDLVAFMVARVERHDRVQGDQTAGTGNET